MKVGYVNLQKVMASIPQYQAIQEKIGKQFKAREDELKKLMKKGQELQEKVQRDAMTMNGEERQKIGREIEELEIEVKLKQKYLQEDANIAQAVEQRNLSAKVQQAISKVVQQENLTLVVKIESILFAEPSMDITDKVIEVMKNP
ncbi:MAG: OmpH family outer membrane protein, partial [Gammaproteobacteria bacterium]|nr:OmpH family outer membrane protein [Gammaproteobacteria bacterium]